MNVTFISPCTYDCIMRDDIDIWHYGLIARWWAEFNVGGVDVEYFHSAIKQFGEPALDAGCGTGRLLIPFLRAGIDIDGSDASQDMLDWCAKKAEEEGLSPNLYPQAMHELDLPRRYQTIIICGSFGLGANRATDFEGLCRLHSHLEPGGMLVMDHYPPKSGTDYDKRVSENYEMPRPWPEQGDRKQTAAGVELELRTRLLEANPLERTITREISVREFIDGVEVGHEVDSIVICGYSISEVESMLEKAGFEDIRITGLLEDRAPQSEDEFVVFKATASCP